MNSVNLMGRATRDPDVRYTESGMAMARFTLAVDKHFKPKEGQPTADFIRIKAIDKKAEFVEKYVKQGKAFWVTGYIETGSYPNKEGVTIYTTDVVVVSIGFAPMSKADSDSPSGLAGPAGLSGPSGLPPAPAGPLGPASKPAQPKAQATQQPIPNFVPIDSFDDDDLPF